jgi:hypothetical protein
MSRTRLIRPEFFADELMATASIPTRLVYIGLWTLCDDAGYFERKPRQIAAALFPYDGQAHRQRITDKALAELEGMGRIKYLECGIHATVPTLPRHGVKGGNKAETIASRHRSTCPSVLVRTSTSKSSSVSVSDSVAGSVSDPDSAGGKPRSLRDVSLEAGGWVAAHAGRKS